MQKEVKATQGQQSFLYKVTDKVPQLLRGNTPHLEPDVTPSLELLHQQMQRRIKKITRTSQGYLNNKLAKADEAIILSQACASLDEAMH
eukprot:1159211-Pelagomonas_calceolata.AAC.11